MSVSAEIMQHGAPWTADEYYALGELPAWPRLELIDGSLIVSPYATLAHQRACGRLFRLFDLAAGDRAEVFTPANVRLGDAGAVIPDVVVCRPGQRGLEAPAAEVLLVAEVESPSTRSLDRMVKAAAYAAAGIPEYWRVELGAGGPVVCRYLLDREEYQLAARAEPGQRLAAAFAGITVTLDPAELAE